MAKISANGAVEICRAHTISRAAYKYIVVMCSDGRVLRRAFDVDYPDGYKVAFRKVQVKYRNPDGLRQACKVLKLKITHEGTGRDMHEVEPGIFGGDFCTIQPERFAHARGELYALNVKRNISHTVSIGELDKAHLRIIAETITAFLEEE